MGPVSEKSLLSSGTHIEIKGINGAMFPRGDIFMLKAFAKVLKATLGSKPCKQKEKTGTKL